MSQNEIGRVLLVDRFVRQNLEWRISSPSQPGVYLWMEQNKIESSGIRAQEWNRDGELCWGGQPVYLWTGI
jgi:hypothetical protein